MAVMKKGGKKVRVLMISSCGGHWIQMNRLVPAFAEESLYFASTEKTYSQFNPGVPFFYVPEASRTSSIFQLLLQALTVLYILVRVRPHIIVTTGAAAGFFALFIGRKVGIKTVWVDSIANVDEVSLSGLRAAKYADLFITQWPHLATETGPQYYGAVI
jgi:UDP-N-acetylglucosamine:LPS N-acetylglucosamine transferase